MSNNCKECGNHTEWAQDLGSAVCTHCGTLADSSQQSALTSPADFLNNTRDVPSSSVYNPPTILKTFRRNPAWDLPGQGANSRHERNKFTIREFIHTLAIRLGYHGAVTRAQAIFDSAMQRASIKWGRAAKLTAGAALVFAMREQGRGDRTYHVAYLLSEPVVTLKRIQLRLLPHLSLNLPRTHAPVHFPAVARHLSTLASTSPATLPKDTLAFLGPFLSSPAALQEVLHTARGLYSLSTLKGEALNAASAGAVACAVLLLALEAHARPPRSAPHTLILATQLGASLGARGAAVMTPYRVLVDIIEAGAACVPWLANSSANRSKRISRRSGVARVVLDVLQFCDELKRAEVAECGAPVSVNVETEDDGGSEGEADSGGDELTFDAPIATIELNMAESMLAVPGLMGTCASAGAIAASTRKPKKPRAATSQATCFLLDPLAHTAPARTTLAYMTHLLSSDAATTPTTLPTRLQLLTAERGAVDDIHDDELFVDGELEGIVVGTDEEAREERERRARTLWMMWGEEGEDVDGTKVDLVTENSGKGNACEQSSRKGKGRVNTDRLRTLLDTDNPFTSLGIGELNSDADEEVGRGSWE